MSDPCKVALVGCGGMGRHHLKVLQEMADFEAVAINDLFQEALDHTGDEFSIGARYTDFNKMYDEVRPDIVAVATQTRGHLEPTVAALERGISVLCEKPIAIDLTEADRMVAATESGAKLAINQQNHVNPGILKAQQLVKEGLIGDLVMVRGRNKCGRKSGNEFMEMGTHVADMMLCLAGAPQWCSGTVQWQHRLAALGDVMEAKEMSPKDRDSGLVVGDQAIGQYGFANGVLGEIHFLGYEKTNNENYGIDVLGTQGQLAVRASGDYTKSLWHLPRPMEGYPSSLTDWQPVDLSDISAEHPIAVMYRSLAAAAANNTEPPGSGVEGRWAFEMIMAIYQSHIENGRRLDLPLAKRRHPLEDWHQEA
jgi:predicted dehydrogenase